MSQQKAKAEDTAAPTAAPPPPATWKASKSHRDQVKEDGVKKELYRKEEETRRSWDDKWGFMKNPKRLWLDEAGRRSVPTSLFTDPGPARTSSWSDAKLEGIKLRESGKVAETSSGVVGWRASNPENDYNRLVGPLYLSRRLTMRPPLGEDEPDITKQRFIFLG